MATKNLKIFIITTIILVSLFELLFLFVLPVCVNTHLKKSIAPFLKEKTGYELVFDSINVKTTPLFKIKLSSKNLVLKDKNKVILLKANGIDSSLFIPALLVGKKKINSLIINDFSLFLTRKADKKIYFGSLPLDFDSNSKANVNLFINLLKLSNINIIFNDETINQKLQLQIKDAEILHNENKNIKIFLRANVLINGRQKSDINIDFMSKLPFTDNLKSGDMKCLCDVKNIDFSDYSKIISSVLNNDILSVNGLLNIHSQSSDNGLVALNSTLSGFSADMKNPLDSIHSDGTISFLSVLDFDKNVLRITNSEIKSKNWSVLIGGMVKDYLSLNPKIDLKINIPSSDIHSMYWLLPSIAADPQNVMQKFKKYGAWGKVRGSISLKGSVKSPEVYGQLEAEDVYIVKDNPLVPHCKILAKFLKNQVKITTRVFAGFGEYVDVDGIAEMKIYGKGDFYVKSSQNVDLATAEYMLVPVHEVVGFDIGPVPYMKIKGKGNIDIHTKGTILDGIVDGQFNYKNATVSLNDLNTIIDNAYGSLDFDGKNMHFYSKQAFIKKQPIKIDGLADLSGNIDFDITSPSVELSDLLQILTTSPMLDDRKSMVAPIDNASGNVKITLKLKGVVKDFSSILNNKTLHLSGVINLKNNKGKLKCSPFVLKGISGIIKFDENDWTASLSSMIGSAKIFIKGASHDGIIDLKANANSVKTDELIKILYSSLDKKIIKLPDTHSLLTFESHYKSDSADIDLNKLSVTGYLKPEKKDADFVIYSGDLKLHNGLFEVKKFNAKLFNSKIRSSLKVYDTFSKKYRVNGQLDISNFDVSSLNSIKTMSILPENLKSLLNAYENYSGSADVNVNCHSNVLKGRIKMRDISFEHSYFKTPVVLERGDVVLDGAKVSMRSMIAKVDNIPVFFNASVWDLDKTLKINGYFTSKFSEYFANKYINNYLTYPLKPRGDISITTDISGTLNNLRLRPKIKFAQGSDIYYMGANLGNEDEEREINADLNISGSNNSVYIKNIEYLRYMTSQNDKTYPLVVLTANGILDINKNKKDVYIRNFNIETKNKANIKMFNALFKKSVLKNGMFDCKLNVKGYLANPKILGSVSMENLDMPIYDTTLKNITLKFKDKFVDISADGIIFSSDFRLHSIVKNDFKPPIVIENLDLKSQKVNLDTFIDSLTKIPTPNTATKMVDTSKSVAKIPLNVSDFVIKKGTMSADSILIRNLGASNYEADFVLDSDMILRLNKLGFDVTTGKMIGSATYNFGNGKLKANISAFNVDSNKVASSLFSFKDQIFGASNGNIVVSTQGRNEDERLKNMFGYVYFEVIDGKMPKLGSVEYLLKAGNFIKSGITGASINSFLALIAPIKTGYFDTIKGSFSIKNGIAHDIEIYSKGDNLNIYINGEYDVLQNYANLRVFGRLTQKATNLLGAVGNLSFNSLLNSIPGIKLDKHNKSGIIKDINKIPGVELSEQQYRVFTVKIDGKIDEDKYVKNFRWIE